MRIDKTRNASRNILYGIILRVYQLLIPFAMRTVMMYTIGVKYLGLSSLFTSILSVLNLAELGVGGAMVFAMYKPIAEDDEKMICALMRLYRLYYRIIGAVILLLGLLLTPFLDRLVSQDVPEGINIYYLYYLNLLATVFSYWMFAYRNSILQAHQRVDVCSKVTLVTSTVKYALQIAVLILFSNYYAYVIIALFSQLLDNILLAISSVKLFPQYSPKGKLPKEEVQVINGKIRDLFTSKLGYTIVNSADTIVISSALGLIALAKYQNYYFILTAIMGFIRIIYVSITAGIGNSMLTKSKDENYRELQVLTLLVTWVCGVCIACFAVLFQPFMRIWMGEDMLLDMGIVECLCSYFWLYEVVMLISMYKDAGGIWHEDRFRPLISGIANFLMNVLFVRWIGLYGVVLSTVISVAFISLPWIIHNVCLQIFRRSAKHFFQYLLGYTCAIVITVLAVYAVCSIIPGAGIVTFLCKGVICGISSAALLAVLLSRSPYFGEAKQLFFTITKLNRILKKIGMGKNG